MAQKSYLYEILEIYTMLTILLKTLLLQPKLYAYAKPIMHLKFW